MRVKECGDHLGCFKDKEMAGAVRGKGTGNGGCEGKGLFQGRASALPTFRPLLFHLIPLLPYISAPFRQILT